MSYYFFRLSDPNNDFASHMGSKSSSGGSKEMDYIIQMEAENGAYMQVDANHTFHPQDAVWNCTECAVTQTPLWRIGPQGPKTLCNACGLRYRKRMQVDTKLSLGSLNSKMPGRRSSSRR